MQFVRATRTGALLLLFGTILPIRALQDRQNDKQDKPERRQGRQQQRASPDTRRQRTQGEAQRPQARGQQQQPQRQSAEQPGRPWGRQPQLQRQSQQQRAQQSRQERPQQQQEQSSQQSRQQQRPRRTQQQAAAWQQQRGWLKQGGWQGHNTWQQSRAQRWEHEHRSWAQRGGYGGHYIPQARFSLYFGSQHWFRMRSRPTIYMGYPRFSYNGFSFMLVDPYPEYWTENWYETDDVYIDQDDGYYLYNRRYPSVRLAITVVL